MKFHGNQWYSGFFCLLLLNSALADTSVWKISKADRHLYLGGTVHVLASSDYPLPEPYEAAYRSSRRVVFETDIGGLRDPATQQAMLQRLSYAQGKTLGDVLSAPVLEELIAYCDSRGIAFAAIENFKPGLATTVLLLGELQRLGMAGIGVDDFFHSKSRQDNKAVGQLETIDEQIGFIERMGRGKEDELIEYTLKDLSNLEGLMNSLKRAWRSGDMPEMERIGLEPYLDEFADTLKSLLFDRNEKWIPEIEAMLDTEEVEFVLVGALHLAGDQGLLALLKSRGYSIEQY